MFFTSLQRFSSISLYWRMFFTSLQRISKQACFFVPLTYRFYVNRTKSLQWRKNHTSVLRFSCTDVSFLRHCSEFLKKLVFRTTDIKELCQRHHRFIFAWCWHILLMSLQRLSSIFFYWHVFYVSATIFLKSLFFRTTDINNLCQRHHRVTV